jgi:hypothetical protein
MVVAVLTGVMGCDTINSVGEKSWKVKNVADVREKPTQRESENTSGGPGEWSDIGGVRKKKKFTSVPAA